MVQRKCHKCDEVFDRKSTYDYHINRKTDCRLNNKNTNNENEDLEEIQNILKKFLVPLP